MRSRRHLALLSVVVLALAACSDSDDGADADGGSDEGDLTSEEQEFADAWSTTLQDEEDGFGVPAADADCMAAAIMAELGTGPFDDAEISPADIGEDAENNSPGEVLGGGVISEDQAVVILDAWEADCVELAAILSESARGQFDLDDEGVACFADGLREGDLARNLLLTSFTSDTDDPDEESLGSVVGLLDSCGDGEGGAIVSSIAENLSADGSMTDEDAQCIAQAVVDDIGIDRLTELTAGGEFADAGVEAQQEITAALIAAAGTCGVPASAFGG
jgi:hypothetical protein